MITEFKLFESKLENTLKIPGDKWEQLLSVLSLVVYKGTKRNERKDRNYKSLRIKNIDGYYNDNQNQSTECSFNIEMTNKDKIEAKYTRTSELSNLVENTIYIEINGDLVYNLDSKDFDITTLIDMVGTEYRKYIEGKKWKIK